LSLDPKGIESAQIFESPFNKIFFLINKKYALTKNRFFTADKEKYLNNENF